MDTKNASDYPIFVPSDLSPFIFWNVWHLIGDDEDFTLDPLTNKIFRTGEMTQYNYKSSLQKLLSRRSELITIQPGNIASFKLPLDALIKFIPHFKKSEKFVFQAELRHFVIGDDAHLDENQMFSLFRTLIFSKRIIFHNEQWALF